MWEEAHADLASVAPRLKRHLAASTLLLHAPASCFVSESWEAQWETKWARSAGSRS